MLHTKLFRQTLLLLFGTGLLYLAGDVFYFNLFVWWYDIMMHFLGGVVVAMSTVLAWNFFDLNTADKNKVVLYTLLSVFVVGVLWEIYELYFGMTLLSDGAYYVFDTTKDLVMDVCGGLFAGLYSLKIISRNN